MIPFKKVLSYYAEEIAMNAVGKVAHAPVWRRSISLADFVKFKSHFSFTEYEKQKGVYNPMYNSGAVDFVKNKPETLQDYLNEVAKELRQALK